MASLLLFCFTLTLVISMATSQDRAPHGLSNEQPMAFPPSAYNFFHPKTQDTKKPCSGSSGCSPLPLAAQVESTKAQESRFDTTPRNGLGAGAVVGIVFGLAFVVLVAMGGLFVFFTRQANINRAADPVQPNA